MTHTTWILVAHRAGARLYTQSGKHQPLHLAENIPHPDGRLRNRDLDSDAGGRSFDRFGPQRHALSPQEAPIDHVADLFAKELADKLHAGRTNGDCDRIILVAGPRLLGKLRLALDPPTAKLVVQDLDKDFGELSDHDLPMVLTDALDL